MAAFTGSGFSTPTLTTTTTTATAVYTYSIEYGTSRTWPSSTSSTANQGKLAPSVRLVVYESTPLTQTGYYNNEYRDLHWKIEEFRKAATSRAALIKAWTKASLEVQFKAMLQGVPEGGFTKHRFLLSRERKAMPVRQLFKKRVCGGHQRYRVILP